MKSKVLKYNLRVRYFRYKMKFLTRKLFDELFDELKKEGKERKTDA